MCNKVFSIYRCADSVVQVKSCLGLVVSNGSLELLQAGQFDGGLKELIPISQCPWKKSCICRYRTMN